MQDGRSLKAKRTPCMHSVRSSQAMAIGSAFAVLIGGAMDHAVKELGHRLYRGESAKGGHRLVGKVRIAQVFLDEHQAPLLEESF